MVYFNDKSRLLELDTYRYELQDVEEPNLFREIYDYEHIPKVVFNNRHVSMDPAKEIWITVPPSATGSSRPRPLPSSRL